MSKVARELYIILLGAVYRGVGMAGVQEGRQFLSCIPSISTQQ